MSEQPAHFLYTAEQSRAIDAYAIQSCQLPGPLLMARAARAAFARLLSKVPRPERVQILCGPGNNGGDGLLVAVLAKARGIPTRVFLVDGEPRTADAQAAATRARAAGILLEPFAVESLDDSGVAVDAMLGTGISGPLRPPYREAIERLDSLALPILALDVPSGIDADTGRVQGAAVRASWTISFITAKRGLFTAAGPDHTGELSLDDLEVPPVAYGAATDLGGGVCDVMTLEAAAAALPTRFAAAHKGSFGRLLLVGGERGMGGAIILAAEAALRTGVGLVAAATRPEHVSALLARVPECMVSAVNHRNDLEHLLDWADAIAVGPGLGRQPWGEQMLRASLATGKPLLMDADALNLLGTRPTLSVPAGCVVTPHPGEAARLLGCSTQEVQADRFAAAAQLAKLGCGAVVLKGNGSLVASADGLALCAAGNPGMASGGMGDILSGIIGGLLAQGLSAAEAARLGTILHATAGDCAAHSVGQRGMLASDLIPHLGPLLR